MNRSLTLQEALDPGSADRLIIIKYLKERINPDSS